MPNWPTPTNRTRQHPAAFSKGTSSSAGPQLLAVAPTLALAAHLGGEDLGSQTVFAPGKRRAELLQPTSLIECPQCLPNELTPCRVAEQKHGARLDFSLGEFGQPKF